MTKEYSKSELIRARVQFGDLCESLVLAYWMRGDFDKAHHTQEAVHLLVRGAKTLGYSLVKNGKELREKDDELS